MEYRCKFKIDSYPFNGVWCDVYSKDSISDFADGFWVDPEFRFTKGSDAKYWIPPSKICFIAKHNTPDEG